MKLFRRRKLLVDGNLQFRIIAASLCYVAFYVFMMAAATFIPLIFEMRSLDPNSHRAYLLANSFIYLHRHVWHIALLVLLAVCIHSLLLSHKVAGPLYRFRHIFRALAAGTVPSRKQLRKGDYLQSEMKLINEMLDSLRSRASGLQETQKAIGDAVSGVAKRSRELSDKELTSLVEKLDAQVKRFAEQALCIDK